MLDLQDTAALMPRKHALKGERGSDEASACVPDAKKKVDLKSNRSQLSDGMERAWSISRPKNKLIIECKRRNSCARGHERGLTHLDTCSRERPTAPAA